MSWLDDLLGKVIMLGNTVLPDRKILRFIQGNGVTIVATDNSSTQDGLGSTDITITGGAVAQTVTVDQSPTVNDTDKSFNNVGASGEVIINLPTTPTVGTRFHALVADAQYMRFKANTGQTIQVDQLTSAVAGYTRCKTKGSKATIEAVSSTRWQIHSFNGPWDVDT